jgi:hypothetical protein
LEEFELAAKRARIETSKTGSVFDGSSVPLGGRQELSALPQLLRWQKWMGSSVDLRGLRGRLLEFVFYPETCWSLGFLFAHNTPILYTSFEQSR